MPALAATGMPSDTEQMFGVGARADAMGDAFVAVANDSTAAFWNPAGLTFLQNTELTAVVKSLPKVTQITDSVLVDFGGFPGYESISQTNSRSNQSSASEATFVSLTTPIGRDASKHGTLAFSRALAGFVDRDLTTTQQFDPIEPGAVETIVTAVHDELRVDYNSLTYGWTPAARLSTGVGIVQAQARASIVGSEVWMSLDDPEPFESPIPAATVTGKGFGAILGGLWNPEIRGPGALTLGGSYVTKITLNGLDSNTFGSERPDRLLLGANYRQIVPGSATNSEVQWSLQLSRNGSANVYDEGQLVRHAVWNVYFGGEYDIHRASAHYPIRYGLFTNKSPNETVYGSETWMTIGMGAGKTANEWQAEFALQQGLRTGMSLISVSGGCSF